MDREKNIEKINKLLKKNIAQKIEESIYLFAIDYTKETEMPFLLDSIYVDKFNFLINALELEKIDPSKIANMRPDELNPDKYKKIIQKKELEDYKKKNIITSSAYKCPKCGERKITVTERQTRAADEPTTIYKECNVCGYITIDNG